MTTGRRLRSVKVSGAKSYNQTPLGHRYTEEELKRMRENIPHGVHPRVMAKGHTPPKTSYYTPPVVIPDGAVHPYELKNFATKLIAGIPEGPTLQAQREYWEKGLFDAYYHLYGETWPCWKLILPWVRQSQIQIKAMSYASDPPWNWMAKCRFLENNGFAWSLEDLNYLIDRYPDRQRNDYEQGIFVADKPFQEIRTVAMELGLPNKGVLETLADYAHKLNMG